MLNTTSSSLKIAKLHSICLIRNCRLLLSFSFQFYAHFTLWKVWGMEIKFEKKRVRLIKKKRQMILMSLKFQFNIVRIFLSKGKFSLVFSRIQKRLGIALNSLKWADKKAAHQPNTWLAPKSATCVRHRCFWFVLPGKQCYPVSHSK